MVNPDDNNPKVSNEPKTLDFYEKLIPPTLHVFDRNSIDEITGGVFRAKYLRNLMARRQGPKGTRIGNKVAILREDFLVWVKARYGSAV